MRFGLLLFLVVASNAAADPMPIRAGEHETFTRLVVGIGEGTDWRVEETEAGYTLTTSSTDGFDLASVFNRIPKTRVKSVEQLQNDTLRIGLNCACDLDAFLWRPDELVIDLVDEGPTAPIQEDDTPDAPAISLPLLFDETAFGPPATATPMIDPLPSAELLAAEQSLIQSIARGATQGFLVPVTPAEPSPPQSAPVVARASPPPTIEPEIVENPRPGVGISTALDRNLNALSDYLGNSGVSQCFQGGTLDLSEWADMRDFHVQRAEAQDAAIGEFDEPLAGQDLRLVRLYIYFGLGSEARQVLDGVPTQSRERRLLREMAALIEQRTEAYPILASQADCDPDLAIWALLSGADANLSEQRNAILRAYFELPQPIRGQLKAAFADAFLNKGDTEAAEQILSGRSDEQAGAAELASLDARLASERDNPEQSLTVLRESIDDNPRTAPSDVVTFIMTSVANGSPLRSSDVLLASALAHEYRETADFVPLLEAQIVGHAALKEFPEAMSVLDTRSDLFPEPERLRILSEVIKNATANADDITFLDIAFSNEAQRIEAASQNALADRLLSLGFAQRASTLLATSAQGEDAAERRYLRAQAFLALGESEAGILSILGLSDPRAAQLRAALLEQQGNPSAALAEQPLGVGEVDPLEEFRAQAWERLALNQDPILSEVARERLTGPSTASLETLSDRSDILTSSERTRQIVESLLSEVGRGQE